MVRRGPRDAKAIGAVFDAAVLDISLPAATQP
jgi:hypothetical protein